MTHLGSQCGSICPLSITGQNDGNLWIALPCYLPSLFLLTHLGLEFPLVLLVAGSDGSSLLTLLHMESVAWGGEGGRCLERRKLAGWLAGQCK